MGGSVARRNSVCAVGLLLSALAPGTLLMSRAGARPGR